MAEKKSTLVLNVDLDCHPCKMKMRKALRKFPEIKSQIFDEEQKKVIISGPFDPEKLIKKLYCKVGCKIITGHEILKPDTSSNGKQTVSSSNTTQRPNKTTPPKPEPLVPGPVNIVIGPIGPVCFCRPFQLPNYPILMDCYCRVKNPTCHCNGSRVNCQCGCEGSSNSNGSQGNCQCGCGGNSNSIISQVTCQCGCGGQSSCRFLIEEKEGCIIM